MGLQVETIGIRFGGIPAGLPEFHMPRFRADLMLTLLSPTLTIAMLGAIESLLSAVVADRMSKSIHNSNVELFAQGVANIVSPLVGGLPVTSDYISSGRVHALQDKDIPDYVTIFRIQGPFLFGSTDKLAAIVHATDLAPIVILRLRNMTAIDATGLRAMQDVADALESSGRTLLLCGALPQPAQLMDEAEFHRHVGAENIVANVEAALRRAGEIWAARTPPQQAPPAA